MAESANTEFPFNIMLTLKDIEEVVAYMVAHPLHEGEVRVTDKDKFHYIVNLCLDWKCTCNDFQDFRIPYIHAWRAITKLRMRHFDFIDPIYSTVNWRIAYAHPIPIIIKDNFIPNKNCGPLVTRRRKGHPNERSNQRFA